MQWNSRVDARRHGSHIPLIVSHSSGLISIRPKHRPRVGNSHPRAVDDALKLTISVVWYGGFQMLSLRTSTCDFWKHLIVVEAFNPLELLVNTQSQIVCQPDVVIVAPDCVCTQNFSVVENGSFKPTHRGCCISDAQPEERPSWGWLAQRQRGAPDMQDIGKAWMTMCPAHGWIRLDCLLYRADRSQNLIKSKTSSHSQHRPQWVSTKVTCVRRLNECSLINLSRIGRPSVGIGPSL